MHTYCSCVGALRDVQAVHFLNAGQGYPVGFLG